MREITIARNYAEALFQLGERSGQTERFADLIDGVAGAIESDEKVRLILESPRIPKTQKQDLLKRALVERAPDRFIRFLSAVIQRGRQGMLSAIRQEFLNRVDVKLNRVHAGVVIARVPDEALKNDIVKRLSAAVGKEVIPHFREDPAILGGVVVRVGDLVMDGSIRRKLVTLRKAMLNV